MSAPARLNHVSTDKLLDYQKLVDGDPTEIDNLQAHFAHHHHAVMSVKIPQFLRSIEKLRQNAFEFFATDQENKDKAKMEETELGYTSMPTKEFLTVRDLPCVSSDVV